MNGAGRGRPRPYTPPIPGINVPPVPAHHPSTDIAYIALGSNEGDRAAHLAAARSAIAALDGTRLIAATPVEETEPVGGVPQGAYLNQMVAVETSLAPLTLLDHLQEIERAEGRVRGEGYVRWGPRPLDLDIVRFERRTVREPSLIVPHPELPNRDFWQRELAELARVLGAGAGAAG